MTKWTPQLLSLARIVFGFLLCRHGLEQAFGIPKAWVQADTSSLLGLLKLAALPGGVLVMLGLFTRPVCLALSGLFLGYWLGAPLQETLSGGARLFGARGPSDPLLLNAFFFLYLVAVGPGPWSLDWLRDRESAASTYVWAPYALGALRIVAGFLFIHHGIEKYFTGRVPLDVVSLRALAGLLENLGGPLLMVGLLTRPLAFLLSGEMAFAYFINHAPEGFWESFIEPNQEAAILNCYLFLFLSGAGAGAVSLDDVRSRRRARIQAPIAETIA